MTGSIHHTPEASVDFEILHKIAIEHDNYTSIEWPTGCSYWKLPFVRRFIEKSDLIPTEVHGCMLGLKDRKGLPIKKQWTVFTNHPGIISHFDKPCFKCDRSHKHGECRGKDAVKSAGYIRKLVDIVHQAIDPG